MIKMKSGKLYEGDCFEIMPLIKNSSVDMILCDLPYGITRNKWDKIIPVDKLWKEYKRILKPGGVVALFSHGIFTARIILSNEEWFKYKFTWVKSKNTGFLNARRQPLRHSEDICIFYEKQPSYNPVMEKGVSYIRSKKLLYSGYGEFKDIKKRNYGRFPTDVLYCQTADREKVLKGKAVIWHPTQKPVALARYLIRLYTNEGDIILDNAFGSGSFLVAAALENRKFIGIEKNKIKPMKGKHKEFKQYTDMMKVAVERIKQVESGYYKANTNTLLEKRGIVNVDSVLMEDIKESNTTQSFLF